MPLPYEVYPGICLTTEEKARKNLSQGNRRAPIGTIETEYFSNEKLNSGNLWNMWATVSISKWTRLYVLTVDD